MKRLLAAATLALAALPTIARAAEAPKLDVFGGFSMLRVNVGNNQKESRPGWEAAATFNRGHWGLVADLSGHYKNEFDDLSYMGGLRYARHGEKLTPFVQALAGGLRDRASISVLGVTISESNTSFAWAAGGGFAYRLSGHLDLRAQADYFNVRSNGKNDGNPRFAAGVVYRFGAK